MRKTLENQQSQNIIEYKIQGNENILESMKKMCELFNIYQHKLI